jgi:hypothetical protein
MFGSVKRPICQRKLALAFWVVYHFIFICPYFIIHYLFIATEIYVLLEDVPTSSGYILCNVFRFNVITNSTGEKDLTTYLHFQP